MELQYFIAGSLTTLLSILVGYYISKGKAPENIIGSAKRAIVGVQGAVITDEDETKEYQRLKDEWKETKRKNPAASPPEGLREEDY